MKFAPIFIALLATVALAVSSLTHARSSHTTGIVECDKMFIQLQACFTKIACSAKDHNGILSEIESVKAQMRDTLREAPASR